MTSLQDNPSTSSNQKRLSPWNNFKLAGYASRIRQSTQANKQARRAWALPLLNYADAATHGGFAQQVPARWGTLVFLRALHASAFSDVYHTFQDYNAAINDNTLEWGARLEDVPLQDSQQWPACTYKSLTDSAGKNQRQHIHKAVIAWECARVASMQWSDTTSQDTYVTNVKAQLQQSFERIRDTTRYSSLWKHRAGLQTLTYAHVAQWRSLWETLTKETQSPVSAATANAHWIAVAGSLRQGLFVGVENEAESQSACPLQVAIANFQKPQAARTRPSAASNPTAAAAAAAVSQSTPASHPTASLIACISSALVSELMNAAKAVKVTTRNMKKEPAKSYLELAEQIQLLAYFFHDLKSRMCTEAELDQLRLEQSPWPLEAPHIQALWESDGIKKLLQRHAKLIEGLGGSEKLGESQDCEAWLDVIETVQSNHPER